jgi:hypothetical protein
MERQRLDDLVITRYKEKYNGSKSSITEVVDNTFGGALVVVKVGDAEEICYVYHDETVRIFETATELARFLEDKSNAHWSLRLFSLPVVTGGVFFFTLIAIFISGFFGTYQKEALAILGSIAGAAGGLYYGKHQRS